MSQGTRSGTTVKSKGYWNYHQFQACILSWKRQYPPNKNSEKQLDFFSTKKRKL